MPALCVCAGGQSASKARLRRAGWRDDFASFGVGKTLEAVSKGGAMVAFEPGRGEDGLASQPGEITLAGWRPLPKGHPLREEAMDLLAGIREG